MRLERTRHKSHAPQTCLSTYSSTLAYPICLSILPRKTRFVKPFSRFSSDFFRKAPTRATSTRAQSTQCPPFWWLFSVFFGSFSAGFFRKASAQTILPACTGDTTNLLRLFFPENNRPDNFRASARCAAPPFWPFFGGFFTKSTRLDDFPRAQDRTIRSLSAVFPQAPTPSISHACAGDTTRLFGRFPINTYPCDLRVCTKHTARSFREAPPGQLPHVYEARSAHLFGDFSVVFRWFFGQFFRKAPPGRFPPRAQSM